MTDIRLVREYPHPRAKLWRALTDPEIMALWGMRPEGFAPVVGTRFRLVGKAQRGWRGFVECEVTAVRDLELLEYTWVGNDGAPTLHVKKTLEETPNGTRLVVEHNGYAGVGGFLLAKMIMTPGWKKMLDESLPVLLVDLQDDGTLRPGSTVKPLF